MNYASLQSTETSALVKRNHPYVRIKNINLPTNDLLPELQSYLAERINRLTCRSNKPSKATVSKRLKAIRIVIQGLYLCYCSMNKRSAMLIPLTPSAYKEEDSDKIDIIGFKIMKSVIDAMESLGWIKVEVGYRYKESDYPTCVFPAGDLLQNFNNIGIRWQKIKPNTDTIILRNHDPVTKKGYRIPEPTSRVVRQMRSQVNRINAFIAKHAICLLVENNRLLKIVDRAGRWRGGVDPKPPAMINFSNVSMRRIFSRSSMRLGGRLYGGWWQNLKKEERVHITINGFRTIEVDFDALHPSMVIHMAGAQLPDGDLYNIDDSPDYDKDIEPYKTHRGVIKRFVLAKLNDLEGKHRFSKKDEKTLGLSRPQLLARINKRMPGVTEQFNTDIGLKLQRLDSEIAVLVITKMMDKGHVVLPVHDSFICDFVVWKELKLAMTEAYFEVMGSTINFKAKTVFDNKKEKKGEVPDPRKAPNRLVPPEFPILFDAVGNVDTASMFARAADSVHQQYVSSRKR